MGFLDYPFIDFFQILAFGNVVLMYHELVDIIRQQFFQFITYVILQIGKRNLFLFINFIRQDILCRLFLRFVIAPFHIQHVLRELAGLHILVFFCVLFQQFPVLA